MSAHCDLALLHSNSVQILACCIILVLMMFYLGARTGQKYCDVRVEPAEQQPSGQVPSTATGAKK